MAEIAGLKLIVPSSVAGSGVSVSASGKVTFTAATTISINGCFSATYDNYLVVMRSVASTGTGLDIRMRLAGTDNSTANSYVNQVIYANGTTVAAAPRGTLSLADDIAASYPSTQNGAHFYFYGPYLAQPTSGRGISALGFSGGYINEGAWTHNQSTSYDGFTIQSDGAPTLTGALCVYGLAQ
jgi:hypothetical protein